MQMGDEQDPESEDEESEWPGDSIGKTSYRILRMVRCDMDEWDSKCQRRDFLEWGGIVARPPATGWDVTTEEVWRIGATDGYQYEIQNGYTWETK